jgi:hypothetical protein
MGGGGGRVLFTKKEKIVCFFRHKIKTQMVTNLKAVSFGSSGSRLLTLPNRLLTSLGVPFGGVKTDMA